MNFDDVSARLRVNGTYTDTEYAALSLVDEIAVLIGFAESGRPPMLRQGVLRMVVGRLMHLLKCVGQAQDPVLDLSETNISKYKAAFWDDTLVHVNLAGMSTLTGAYAKLLAAEGLPIGVVTVEMSYTGDNGTSNNTASTVSTTSTVTPAPTTNVNVAPNTQQVSNDVVTDDDLANMLNPFGQ